MLVILDCFHLVVILACFLQVSIIGHITPTALGVLALYSSPLFTLTSAGHFTVIQSFRVLLDIMVGLVGYFNLIESGWLALCNLP